MTMQFAHVKLDWSRLRGQGGVVVISAAVVAIWTITQPIVFTYDTFTYIDQAGELLLGELSARSMFSRLPLFPAILLAFGVTDLQHSVFWLIVLHSVLAVASCWLFYLTARQLAPGGAFVLSLVFIASLLPFINVNYIMTEQIFLFQTMLTINGIVSYLFARTNRETWLALIILCVGTVLMTLTRPQGAYVIPTVFGAVAVLAWRRAWAPLIAAVVAFVAVWSVQAVDQKIRAGSRTTAGSFDSSYMRAPMLLFTFYLDGPREKIRISPANGPASAELKALLLDELVKPDALARRVGYLKSVPPEDVPAYIEKSFAEPDADFYLMLSYIALKERLGAEKADRLLTRVCLETALAYPVETVRLITERLFQVYFNPWLLAVPVHPQFQPGTFQGQLATEIAAAGDYSTATRIDYAIDRNLRWLMQGAIVLALITLPIAFRYPTWRATIALLALGLYLNFAVAVGNHPLFRYAFYAIPTTLLCAYIGTVALVSTVRDRYRKRSVIVN